MTTTNPPINYNWDNSDMIHSSYTSTSQPWWKVTFTSTVSIKTVGIISRDDCCAYRVSRMIATVGYNANPNSNPTCIYEYTMTDGGFYMCSSIMQGNVFGFWMYADYFNFMEAMAYSQEAIQMNALSTSIISGSAHSGHPISNAI